MYLSKHKKGKCIDTVDTWSHSSLDSSHAARTWNRRVAHLCACPIDRGARQPGRARVRSQRDRSHPLIQRALCNSLAHSIFPHRIYFRFRALWLGSTRTHVGNEANAAKADAVLQELKPKLAALPGYVKTKRTVCKAEWAYEVDIIFKDLDSFKGYMESDLRAKVATPAFEKVLALKPADAPEHYMGARVYDEL